MKTPAIIRAVTFDAGGTLIEPWPSVGHVYAEVAARYGVSGRSPEQITERFAAAWRGKSAFDYSLPAWRALVDATFGDFVPEDRITELFPALYQRFKQAEVWRVFDDVTPILRELRAAGFKLGIISNWDDRLRPLLEGLGLASWFDAIVISTEAGVTKPSRAIFDQAASALHVPAESILHVGDSGDEDLRGAQAAGFSALLVDRRAENSWALQSLRALPAALANIHFGAAPD
jgi:putative hydrolase of the HAD superfamily